MIANHLYHAMNRHAMEKIHAALEEEREREKGQTMDIEYSENESDVEAGECSDTRKEPISAQIIERMWEYSYGQTEHILLLIEEGAFSFIIWITWSFFTINSLAVALIAFGKIIEHSLYLMYAEKHKQPLARYIVHATRIVAYVGVIIVMFARAYIDVDEY